MQKQAEDPDLFRRITRCLEHAPLFSGLDLETRNNTAARLALRVLPGGATLFRAGDPGDSLYLVLSGRLAVRASTAAGGQIIAELGADDVVGEMSLVGQRRRANDVVALRDAELLRLDRADFEALTREHPEALDGLMQTLVERVAAVPRSTARRPRTLAIMLRSHNPGGSRELLDSFIARLAASLQRGGARIRIAREEQADRSPGWFSELEAASDYVIYSASVPEGPWPEFCRRQADRIVELARLDDVPMGSCLLPLRDDDRSLNRIRELVLLRDGTAPPGAGSTAAWLDISPDTPHHHAALASSADFDRLARLLTGRAVGIVLAGGGARGFSHIGAVRALREASVPLDLLGGTSMGAIVAAGVAAGWNDAQLYERFRHAFVNSNPLSDYTVPFVSLFAGRRVAGRLRAAFGSLDIEDLPLSMFCVGANLTTSRAQYYRRGPLLRRLRATVAIPGVLPPMVERGEVIVDGGVIDNFPVKAMRDLGRGPVIGVDIETGGALAAGADVMEPWSATEFIRRLVWRRDQTLPFPSIVRILLRSALVASSHRALEQRQAADLLILPPMTDFDLLDWSSYDRAIEVGYETARQALERIRGSALGGRLFWPD